MLISDKNKDSLILILFATFVIFAIISVIALPRIYNYFSYNSIISNGNIAELNKLIRDQDFLEYATNEQGQQALECLANNIASSSINEKYELIGIAAFRKFENDTVGKLVVASMTDVIKNAPIDEKLKFLKNKDVLLYINDNQRKLILSSIVDYPITKLENSSLNTLFFEICNENEVEKICKKIKENNKDLPQHFVEYLIKSIIDNFTLRKTNYLKDLLYNYESFKDYIPLYAYETAKANIYNNSEFLKKLEEIVGVFPELFNSEVKRDLESLRNAYRTINDAENTANKERVDSEIKRLREERNMLPKSEYISGFVHELVFDGSNMFPPSCCYLVTILGQNCLLITTETKFSTKGYFSMYASTGLASDLGAKLKEISNIYGIKLVFQEIGYNLRKIYESEREKLTKEINDIERNSKEVYEKISELKGKLEELKNKIVYLLKPNSNNIFTDSGKSDIDLFVKMLDFEMVKCTAGSFMMGSPEGELGRGSEEIQHKVTISKPFYIGKYEVTQKNYKTIIGNNPSKHNGDNRPVENVGLIEAKEFCNKLNEIYKDKLPSGYRFDLPTEAQWEYACRAGTTTALNNGKNITSTGYDGPSCPNLDEVAWYETNSDGTTHEVGKKKPNAWGIFDMHGNVWEWCRDYYSEYNHSENIIDPVVVSGIGLICRGGGCTECADLCRSACRSHEYEGYFGFRIVLVNDETNEERARTIEKNRIISKETNIKINSDIIKNIMNNMVKCPAGSFIIGSPEGELGRNNNETQHKVIISKPFYINKYEVTQEEYEAIMGENPSGWEGKKKPVSYICWYDAKTFCIILNKYCKDKLPLGYKFDLPTEAQWEYACRAGTTTALNNGKNLTKEYANIYEPCKNLDEVAWYGGGDPLNEEDVHIIGQKKPNAWGIYDMHGSVSEWCSDYYADYRSYTVTDPINNNGFFRITRGGGSSVGALSCRSANRCYSDPGLKVVDCGFRLAIVPDEDYDSKSSGNYIAQTQEPSVSNTLVDSVSYSANNNLSNNQTIGIITAKSGVNARKWPNAKAQKVGSFAYNKEVTILNTNGPKQTIENISSNWYKVTDGKLTGWVFGGFVSIVK